MEEYTQITLDEWVRWKEDIREKLRETSGNFVYIGYRLKQIRDSGMFGGAADIFEFAQKEYGLSKSTVSRFIAINEKFSEGGNSLELKEEFKAIGSSKLAEMLTLTDSECLLITERTTVKEIRDLKNLGRKETEDSGQEEYTPLEKCILDLFRNEERHEALNLALKAETEEDFKVAAEAINPGGYATHKKGILFLFLYDYKSGIAYKSMTEREPRRMSWEEFLQEIQELYESVLWEEDPWKAVYDKKEEKEAEKPESTSTEAVATSQQEESLKTENRPETASEEQTEEEERPATAVSEEQIPGQTSMEKDFPEYCPQNSDTEKTSEVERAEEKEAEKPESTSTEAVATSQQTEESEQPSEQGEKFAEEDGQRSFSPAAAMSREEKTRLMEDLYTIAHGLSLRIYRVSPDSKEDLKKMYKNAIDLAAGLERLING